MLGPAIVHAGLADLHRPQAGLNPAGGQAAIAEDQPMAVGIAQVPVLLQILGHLLFNGLLQQALGPQAKGLFQHRLADLACVRVGELRGLPCGGCVHLGVFHWFTVQTQLGIPARPPSTTFGHISFPAPHLP